MIKTFYFNDLRTCCYILWDKTNECAIVDPGCYSDSEKNRLVKYIEENQLTPKLLINTHGHFDHIMGNVFVCSKWNIPTYMNREDLPQLANTRSYCNYFGYDVPQPSDNVIDMKDGDMVAFGETKLLVSHTPGHSEGSVILYNEKNNYIISGDSLFEGSIGRTDLPGGDSAKLMDSLFNKILILPPGTRVYPGHGAETTIAKEIASNPYCK